MGDDVIILTCPACGDEAYMLGQLGPREHRRCRRCGLDHSEPAVRA